LPPDCAGHRKPVVRIKDLSLGDGCVAAAEGREETIALMREAISFHLEGLAEAGEPAPEPSSESVYVEVNA
jgi:predicted RNase H-like HicB family nuclease